MKVIADRVWREPAVFIGAAVTVALLVLALATSSDWTAEVIAGIVAPLASALGIREFVTPYVGEHAAGPGRPPTELDDGPREGERRW